ncbi:hypothetical protein BC830DRAFT_1086776 [Chytriomyces sp. MP71]|nr:hypothetical protein BC830DRAFT_1086776 [Chytriomyces sp. MP71]
MLAIKTGSPTPISTSLIQAYRDNNCFTKMHITQNSADLRDVNGIPLFDGRNSTFCPTDPNVQAQYGGMFDLSPESAYNVTFGFNSTTDYHFYFVYVNSKNQRRDSVHYSRDAWQFVYVGIPPVWIPSPTTEPPTPKTTEVRVPPPLTSEVPPPVPTKTASTGNDVVSNSVIAPPKPTNMYKAGALQVTGLVTIEISVLQSAPSTMDAVKSGSKNEEAMALRRHTLPAVARCLSTAPSPFLSDYPLRLSEGARETVRRRGYFDEGAPRATWMERHLLMPFRLRLADIAGAGFLNNRFDSEREFYPFLYSRGVGHALPVLFQQLSGWDGSHHSHLKGLLTPQLYALLAGHHAALAQQGLALQFDWKYTHQLDEDSSPPDQRDVDLAEYVTPKYVWITFGSEENATSTLLMGPVTSRYHLVAFIRRITTPSTTSATSSSDRVRNRRLFREICFEYAYEPGDVSRAVADGEEVPDFAWKRKQMLLGQVVGIDTKVHDAKLAYRLIRQDDSSVVEQGIVDYTGDDAFSLRMESSHFMDTFPEDGLWRVADLDSFLVYPRLVEEEKEPMEDVDD